MRRSENAARAAKRRAERVEPDEAERTVRWSCGMKYLLFSYDALVLLNCDGGILTLLEGE